MTTITIRNVPDEVRNELASRAAGEGRSLQEYMLAEVIRLSAKPTVESLAARVRTRKSQSGIVINADSILGDRDADRR